MTALAHGIGQSGGHGLNVDMPTLIFGGVVIALVLIGWKVSEWIWRR